MKSIYNLISVFWFDIKILFFMVGVFLEISEKIIMFCKCVFFVLFYCDIFVIMRVYVWCSNFVVYYLVMVVIVGYCWILVVLRDKYGFFFMFVVFCWLLYIVEKMFLECVNFILLNLVLILVL